MTMEQKNKDLKAEMMISDAELDLVAGGATWYYYEDTAQINGKSVDGYLMEAEDTKTGKVICTRFIEKGELENFMRARSKDDFFKGYLKPEATDTANA